MKRISVFILLLVVLFGCSNNFEESKEKADALFADSKCTEALAEYEIARENKSDDEVTMRIEHINTYVALDNLIEDEDWHNANELLENIDEEDIVDSPLKEVMEEKIEIASAMFANQQEIVNEIAKIEKLIENKKIEEAIDSLEIFNEHEMAAQFRHVQEELEEEIEAATAELQEKERRDQEEKAEQTRQWKEEFLAKFDELEEISQREIASAQQGDSFSMYVNEVYDRADQWDVYMNEVYQILKENMSEADFALLKQEQSAWLQHKEQEMADDAISFENTGQAGSEPRAWIHYDQTRDRCYDLVNDYF